MMDLRLALLDDLDIPVMAILCIHNPLTPAGKSRIRKNFSLICSYFPASLSYGELASLVIPQLPRLWAKTGKRPK